MSITANLSATYCCASCVVVQLKHMTAREWQNLPRWIARMHRRRVAR